MTTLNILCLLLRFHLTMLVLPVEIRHWRVSGRIGTATEVGSFLASLVEVNILVLLLPLLILLFLNEHFLFCIGKVARHLRVFTGFLLPVLLLIFLVVVFVGVGVGGRHLLLLHSPVSHHLVLIGSVIVAIAIHFIHIFSLATFVGCGGV